MTMNPNLTKISTTALSSVNLITQPDILYAMHQCAQYNINPKAPHGCAVKYLGRYLFGMQHRGLIMAPNTDLGFEIYTDADFAGTFNTTDDLHKEMARSRMGFIIFYAGCNIF